MKRGTRFIHKHWLNDVTGKPLECIVTAVRQGVVYWKATDDRDSFGSGKTMYFETDKTEHWVKEVIA